MDLTEDERLELRAIRARRRSRYVGKLSLEQREELIRRYMAGETMAALAKRFGVKPPTVCYHLDRATGER